ncbi:hypothetical protein F5Y09DRAFT_323269 [Xylaria sp. FL1042]|nr:hypothetical protein F5Y09DRAFT_323269 [Xylaria sp. FL1042]
MVARGLGFLKYLMSSDTDLREKIIQANTPICCTLLPKAVECAPDRLLSERVLPKGVFMDHTSRPGKGWFDFKDLPYDSYYGMFDVGIRRRLLRVCGYVFWDAERLEHPTVHKALKTVAEMDDNDIPRLYNATAYDSAEEQLKGFQLPRTEMFKILDEFAETEELDF